MEQTKIFSKSQTSIQDSLLIVTSSILLSLLAYIKIPLFFTPVPLVLQNTMAVALGAFLGSKKGSLAVFTFLMYGICHLPVFAGGSFGLSTLLSPISGGYLLGYCVAACITGKILESNSTYTFLAVLAGHLTILLMGTMGLSLSFGLEKAFYLGFLPFVLTDVIKSMILTKILQIRHKR